MTRGEKSFYSFINFGRISFVEFQAKIPVEMFIDDS